MSLGNATGMTELEAALMNLMLAGEGRGLAALRQQAATCRVTRRRLTGVGFFTTFDVDPKLRAPLRPRLVLGVNGAEVAGLKNGAFFDLFVLDGVLSFLEGSCAGEDWPETITTFSLAQASARMPAEPKAR